jgi:hypothetical protein
VTAPSTYRVEYRTPDMDPQSVDLPYVDMAAANPASAAFKVRPGLPVGAEVVYVARPSAESVERAS